MAESHCQMMELAQFDEDRFPKAVPKILGRDSCIAILETLYLEQVAQLMKQKLPALLEKMCAKLIVVRPRQRRMHR